MPIKNIKKAIIKICRDLHRRNMLAAGDGNVSYRLDDGRIFITPSGRPKAFIHDNEMALIREDGEVISGQPSSERQMHLAVYKKCSQARAVVHAHPPTCIAWSIAKPHLTELPCEALSEVILATGEFPLFPMPDPQPLIWLKLFNPICPNIGL